MPLGISRAAIENGAVVGVALFRDNGDIPFLDMLFILPAWQRKGLASTLLARAANALHAAGYPILTSRYDLANAASRSWHRRAGFVDSPGWLATRHLWSHYRNELYRLRSLGDADEAERARLNAEIERWRERLCSVWGDDPEA
jgi:GNAT superfamily N-acetyltransferase